MSNIKSLEDLTDKPEDDSKYNDYYAGGEKSGQLIRGAPEDEDSEDDRVSSLFNKAREYGAVQGTPADLEPDASSSFRGSGRTLAGNSSQPAEDKPRTHVITFYRDGVFTVNGGPARHVNDAANVDFIDSISKGECPAELDPGASKTPVSVNLVRKDEDYKPPEKPKYVAFSGGGRTLGASSSAAGPSTNADPLDPVDGQWQGVDEFKPTTPIQLRLADGSRLVAKFNVNHTVGDIRRFIHAARPDLTGPYTLATAFPPQLLTDNAASLEAAGLLNAVIIQKS